MSCWLNAETPDGQRVFFRRSARYLTQHSCVCAPALKLHPTVDGRHCLYTRPEENGELISIVPTDPKTPHWSDLVRTPTQLIPTTLTTLTTDPTTGRTRTPSPSEASYVLFYAARDTRKAKPPYVNCSVPPPHNTYRGSQLRSAATKRARIDRDVPDGSADTHMGGAGAVSSAPPPPPPGWSDGCFYGLGRLTVTLDFSETPL